MRTLKKVRMKIGTVKSNSRTYQATINSAIGMLTAVGNILINFGVRVAIVHTLGEEINGLHNLFQSLLSVLAVVETSMMTAMIIHMYEPIQHRDMETISKTMALYKRIYAGIAAFTLVLGGIVCLFMDSFIHSSLSQKTVQAYFLVFLTSAVVNYLTYSYRIVLFAGQKNRISALATMLSEFLFRTGGLVAAWLMGNYVYYLIFMIGEKICGNQICKLYVRRSFPELDWSWQVHSDPILRKKIAGTVKPLFVSQLANVLQNSSQSILLSMLLGSVTIVGYYGNYQLVMGAVGLMYSQIGAAFTSGFGNLAIGKNQARMYDVYRRTVHLMSVLTIVICSGFLVCIQDFISWVFGKGFLLSDGVVCILTVTLFITLINIPAVSVQNAMGLHRCDARLMVLQAVLSVSLGYIGGTHWGIEGILLGMLLPLVLFTTICKGILIYRRAFDLNWVEHVICVLSLIFKGTLACGISWFVCRFIQTEAIALNILLKGFTAVALCLGVTHLTSSGNIWHRQLVDSVRERIKAISGI